MPGERANPMLVRSRTNAWLQRSRVCTTSSAKPMARNGCGVNCVIAENDAAATAWHGCAEGIPCKPSADVTF